MPSTQDVARETIDILPVLVVAASQTMGRGRSGADWENADRALAVSYAFHHDPDDQRPFSLMAGVAAVDVTGDVAVAGLKWPNDLLAGTMKVGGILVERSGDVTVVGLGLNLYWPEPPAGVGALFEEDPGETTHLEMGALWGAGLNRMLDGTGWPLARYRELCVTLGRHITWEPDGAGQAVDVDDDGGLIVEQGGVTRTIFSGEVRHLTS